MNFAQLTNSSRVNNLTIIKNNIIHLIPELNKDASQMLFSSGLKLTNCIALVTKSQPVKIGPKTFNTKKLYLNTKATLISDSKKTKTIPVLQKLPTKLEKGKFLLIDQTVMSRAISYIKNITNDKQALIFMLDKLKIEFQKIKSKFPDVEHSMMFLMGPGRKEESLIDLFLKLGPEFESTLNIFDRYMMCSINVDDKNSKLFPIVEFNKKGKISIIRRNIQYAKKLLETAPIKLQIQPNDVPANTDLKEIADVGKSAVQNIDKLEINEKQLRKVLKRLDIDDKTTADNIKSSINSYIKNKKITIKESDLEKVTLKAINQTIFNTDQINDQYIDNPAKLISKLKEVNSYQQKLIFNDPKTPHILSPKVIDLKRVTGLVRQKYEFSDNIHKTMNTLFKSLETQNSNPIKVLKIQHQYQDNNLDRVIKYTITLKNLSGGYKKPYDVVIKIPALVNDKYFKLNGKTYIMASQQFYVPITKTDPNECRLLTNFAIVTLSVVNMKFNISELEELVQYIRKTYPEVITEIRKENNKIIAVDFKGDITVNLYSNDAYSSPTETLTYDGAEDEWVITQLEDGSTKELQMGKTEFLFERISQLLVTINPEEQFQKSKYTIPYIQFYLGGVKIPLILYMWQQLGLINALIKLGIDNDTVKVDDYIRKEKDVTLPLKDKMILAIHPQNKREQLIVNGLLTIPELKRAKFAKNEINKQETVETFISDKYGTRALYNLNHITQNVIDPITKQILEFQDKSTNLVDLLSQDMIYKLLNDKTNAQSDLSIYRQRQAEVIFGLMYEAVSMSHNTYKNEVAMGNEEDAKAFLNKDYIIDCLLGVHPNKRGNTVLELAEPTNMLAELKLASKLIKMGPGGIPNEKSIKPAHRNLHLSSNIGNVG